MYQLTTIWHTIWLFKPNYFFKKIIQFGQKHFFELPFNKMIFLMKQSKMKIQSSLGKIK